MRDIDSRTDLQTLAAFLTMALLNLGPNPLMSHMEERNVLLGAHVRTRPAAYTQTPFSDILNISKFHNRADLLWSMGASFFLFKGFSYLLE
jgi:hypothetical protein